MVFQLNHVALLVKELDKCIEFYEKVIGLTRIDRPAFDFPGAWFKIGGDQQLHLIGLREADTYSSEYRPRGNHFALRVHSYREEEEKLRKLGVEYIEPKKRPDGAIQIFLKDPDGYFVELVEIMQ